MTQILNVASVTLLRPFSECKDQRDKQSEKIEGRLWEPIIILRDEVDTGVRSMEREGDVIQAKG